MEFEWYFLLINASMISIVAVMFNDIVFIFVALVLIMMAYWITYKDYDLNKRLDYWEEKN